MMNAIRILEEEKRNLEKEAARLAKCIERARFEADECTSERNQTLTALQDVESAITKLSGLELPTHLEGSEYRGTNLCQV